MTVCEDQPSRPDGDPAALDAMLHEARWPEPDDQQLVRLRSTWMRIGRRRRRRRVLATSAVLLCGVLALGLWHQASRPETGQPDRVVQSAPVTPPRSAVPVPEPPDPAKSPAVSRARLYEGVVIAAVERRWAARRSQVATRRSADAVDAAIARLVADPAADVESIVRELASGTERLEQRLFTAISQGALAERMAAARLLARVATRQSYQVLLRVAQFPELRGEASAALVRLSMPLELARLASLAQDPRLRCNYLAALLSHDTEQATTLYLGFVANPQFAADALAAVPLVAQPPVGRLFGYLDHSRVPLRLAAARVLGRVDDPAVSARLVRRALHHEGLREALIALVESKNQVARQFVMLAWQDPTLAASVRAALNRAASFPN